MHKVKLKKVDVNKEKSLHIKVVRKKVLTSEVLFQKKNVVVESDNLEMAYTIFALQALSDKYKLSYDSLLVLLYLQELSLFAMKIRIFNRLFKLDNLFHLGYIKEDYSNNNKKLFRLTEKAIPVVKEFYDLLLNSSSFISSNRQTDLDLNNKVKSTLGNYFSD